MDRAELLEKLRAEHTRLEETLSGLTEEQMISPDLPDGLSVKDTLAHLAVWNRRGTIWLAAAARGETPEIPAPGATWADMDRMNEESYHENLHTSLHEALAEYRDSYRQLVEQLRAFSDEAWNAEYLLGDDAEPTRVTRIAGWRCSHLVAHAGLVHDFAESQEESAQAEINAGSG